MTPFFPGTINIFQQFLLRTHEVTPFANKKNSMKTMLDVSGDLAQVLPGEEIVVFAFGSNTKVWRETAKWQSKRSEFLPITRFRMLSPEQSKSGLPCRRRVSMCWSSI